MLVPGSQASPPSRRLGRQGDLTLNLEWALASWQVWPCCLWCGREGPAGLLAAHTPPLSSVSSLDAPTDVHVEKPRENLTISHPYFIFPLLEDHESLHVQWGHGCEFELRCMLQDQLCMPACPYRGESTQHSRGVRLGHRGGETCSCRPPNV